MSVDVYVYNHDRRDEQKCQFFGPPLGGPILELTPMVVLTCENRLFRRHNTKCTATVLGHCQKM